MYSQFNPYMPSYQQMNQYQPMIQQNLTMVNGMDGAKAYQMRANSTVALFDANEDIMYVKCTDGAGFPTIRTFRFEEINDIPKSSENQVDLSQYITRSELTDILNEYKGGLTNVKQPVQESKQIESKMQFK